MRAVVRNRTGVEDWIVEKACHRRQGTEEVFVFPYDLGLWANVRQVINISCAPVGDGVNWKVAHACDSFTLTVFYLHTIYTLHPKTNLFESEFLPR